MHFQSVILSLALCLSSVDRCYADSTCQFGPPTTNFQCPTDNSTVAYCEGSSLSSNIIFRCIDGCPQPGNCNDNLAGVPPVGVKTGAECWQESDTAGNAQCTFDCVNVTMRNGTAFYPLGCSFQIQNGTGSPSSTSLTVLGPTPTSTPSSAASATATESSNAAAVLGASTWSIGLDAIPAIVGAVGVFWAM